jgi:hypothetical protein
MHLKVEIACKGQHPSERILRVRDADGAVHATHASARSLRVAAADASVAALDIGFPVGRRGDGAYLVEITNETATGLRRLYVPMSALLRDPDELDGGVGVRLALRESWVGNTVASVTLRGATTAEGVRKTLEFSVNPDLVEDGTLSVQGPAAKSHGAYLFLVDDLRGPREAWVDPSSILAAGPTLDEAMAEPGDLFVHFKGGVYRRLRAEGDATVYEGLWPNRPAEFRRPTAEFEGDVAHDGNRHPRFAPVKVGTNA